MEETKSEVTKIAEIFKDKMKERLKREKELAQEHHLRDKDLSEECCQKEHELANEQARNNQK